MSAAALRIQDPGVSEAHALVSLRGLCLKLLRLRGLLYPVRTGSTVLGPATDEITLEPGLRLALRQGLIIEVGAVTLPAGGLVLAVQDGPPVPLPFGHTSITQDGKVLPRPVAGALASIWSAPEGWYLCEQGGQASILEPGERDLTQGMRLKIAWVPASGVAATEGGGLEPLRIVARYDSLHLFRVEGPPIPIGGIPARMVSALVSLGAPANWKVAAGEVWFRAKDEADLRHGWDKGRTKLRQLLFAHGIARDLILSTGRGNVELNLLPGDTVVDETEQSG